MGDREHEGEDADGDHQEVLLDDAARLVAFHRVQLERRTQAERVLVEQREDDVDPDEPRAVDHHQLAPLAPVHPRDGHTVLHRMESGSAVHERAEQELEWIDVERDHEQQRRIEQEGAPVVERVAAEVDVLRVPEHQHEHEAQAERDEAV